MLGVAAVCLAATPLSACPNQRFVGLPTAIGVMVAALVLSVVLIGLGRSDSRPGFPRPHRP